MRRVSDYPAMEMKYKGDVAELNLQHPPRLSTKSEVNASDFLYLDAETSKNQHIASDLWYYNGKGSEPYAA